MAKQHSTQQFFKLFPTDEICLEHLFNVRFGQGYECVKCKRSAKWYRIQAEKAFSCQWCGHHIHPMVGTPFEGSRTSLQSWFFAIYLFTVTRAGVSGKQLQRSLGVTYKAAWRMGQQIRKHMAFVDGETPLFGTVEIDETYVGGKSSGGKRGRGAPNKAVILGMMQKGGDVMTRVVPNVKRASLYPIIEANVEKGSTIQTDELRSYATLDQQGYTHETVNHGRKEYARNGVHVNGMEGYWARLKLSIRGTHVWVSPKYLENYAKEFEYRFNSRHCPDKMLPELLSSFPSPSN